MSAHAAVNSSRADAFERALQAFWIAVGMDIAIAIGVGTTGLLAQFDVTTPVFWAAFGGMVLKSVVTGVAQFLVKLKLNKKAEAGAVG